jgi:hypothetical protein
MIASNSRYAQSTVVTETIDGEDVQYITPSAPTSYTFSYNYYVLKGSDRIDNVAASYFSDPTQWFLIGYANPQVMNWFDTTPGEVIRIPLVSVNG